MSTKKVLKTKRLILRPWRDEDLEPFAQLNADPRVREFFPSVLTREESDHLAWRITEELEKNGYGFWAVSAPNVSDFIGFIGIRTVTFESHFTSAVEVGWRLAYDHWGKGYATEGALESLKFGFADLDLKEIVSFTPVGNIRSQNVMKKVGMRHNEKDDFNHPELPEGHHLQRHVLYRIERDEWKQSLL